MRAVYNYNSRQDSPNRGMELELSFRNGDVITVYGSMVRTPVSLSFLHPSFFLRQTFMSLLMH